MKNPTDQQPSAMTESKASANEADDPMLPGDLQSDAGRSSQTESASPGLKRRRARDKYATHIEPLRSRVYDFAELSEYSWRERLNIILADWFFYLLIRIICMTVRWERRGFEHLEGIYASRRRAIFTFWHSCIFTATYVWRKRGIVVMSSRSKDGEFTSRFIKRFGYGTARGSATRGAGRALAEMSECLRNGIDVAFTIDGPKGPVYVAKPGAVTLARHSGQAIFPFHVAVKRYIELPSWDRLKIPLPFTRAITVMGEPIYVPGDASPEEVKAKQLAVQNALDELRREGERWRESKAKPATG